MIVAARVVQILVMVGAPVALWLALRRRWAVPWPLLGAGAIGFVASQVVHLPLNWAIGVGFQRGVFPHPPAAWAPVVQATILGLTAGLCEEPARWVVMTRWKRAARGARAGIALGAGHGGIESVIFGLLTGASFVSMLSVRGIDPARLGVPADQVGLAARQIEAYWSMPPYIALLGGVERLLSMSFHVAASAVVMAGVVRGRIWPLLAAIAWHAIDDGVMVWVVGRRGIVAAEVAVAVMAVPIPFVLLWAWRSMGAGTVGEDAGDGA